MGPFTPTQRAFSGQPDSPLNSPMIVFQVEKKTEKYTPQAQGWCSKPREGRGIFSDCYQNTQLCHPPPPPLSLWYVSIMQRENSLRNWGTECTHFISRLLLTAWDTHTQQCVFTLWAFSHIAWQHFSVWKQHFGTKSRLCKSVIACLSPVKEMPLVVPFPCLHHLMSHVDTSLTAKTLLLACQH